MSISTIYHAALYCRLSKDDDQCGESVSIGTQRAILEEFCREHGYPIHKVYFDDGYSGTNFNRPGFQELLDDDDLIGRLSSNPRNGFSPHPGRTAMSCPDFCCRGPGGDGVGSRIHRTH